MENAKYTQTQINAEGKAVQYCFIAYYGGWTPSYSKAEVERETSTMIITKSGTKYSKKTLKEVGRKGYGGYNLITPEQYLEGKNSLKENARKRIQREIDELQKKIAELELKKAAI